MSITDSDAVVDVEELTPAEAAELFDGLARTNLNLSGNEFLEAWDAGKFADTDPDSVPGLLDVLMALPLVR